MTGALSVAKLCRRGWQQRAPAFRTAHPSICPKPVAFKMADGLCTEGSVGNLIEKTLVKDYNNIVKCLEDDRVSGLACDDVKSFFINAESGEIFGNMCRKGSDSGFVDVPCSDREEDCRKKRCADRYDSSESSDR